MNTQIDTVGWLSQKNKVSLIKTSLPIEHQIVHFPFEQFRRSFSPDLIGSSFYLQWSNLLDDGVSLVDEEESVYGKHDGSEADREDEDEAWKSINDSTDDELLARIGDICHHVSGCNNGNRSQQYDEECDLSSLTLSTEDGDDDDDDDATSRGVVCQEFVGCRFYYSDASEDSHSEMDMVSANSCCTSSVEVLEPADRMRIVRRGHNELIVLMDEDISMEIARGYGRLDNVVIRTGSFTRVLPLRERRSTILGSFLHCWCVLNSSRFFSAHYLWPLDVADGGYSVSALLSLFKVNDISHSSRFQITTFLTTVSNGIPSGMLESTV